MLLSEEKQNNIINQITNEVLNEIEKSKTVFTNEEIQEKINKKLDDFFRQQDDEADRTKSDNENEKTKLIENEFTKIEDNLDIDNELNSLLNFDEKTTENDSVIIEDKPEMVVQEKKKFYQEISDIYKEELQNSLNCFKNALDSFKIMKDTSFIEKFGIFLFLAIPAILGGAMTIIIALVIFLLWQLHILLKVFMRFFTKLEKSIKDTIGKMKRKIANMKINGSWFNRLIFSNTLYSVIMMNGILYLMIRGTMIALRSASEIDRIIANMVSKSGRAISIVLRGPSELALNNFRSDAMVSTKSTTKQKGLGGSSKLRLNNLAKAKQNLARLNNELSRKARLVNASNIKNQISKGIAEKLQASSIAKQEKLNNLLNSNTNDKLLNIPSSSKLSQSERERNYRNDIGGMIFNNILNNIAERAGDTIKEFNRNQRENSKIEKTQAQDPRIEEDIRQERREKNQEVRSAENSLKNSGIDSEKVISNYENGRSLNDSMRESTPNWEKMNYSQQVDSVINFADIRVGKDDLDDIKEFESWKEQNKEASFENFLEYKVQDARSDLKKEESEFIERHGVSCNDLMDAEMKARGYENGKILTDEQFKDVAISISEKFPEDKRLDVVKDLREHNLTYRELRKCRDELNQERENSKGNFESREKERSQSRSHQKNNNENTL